MDAQANAETTTTTTVKPTADDAETRVEAAPEATPLLETSQDPPPEAEPEGALLRLYFLRHAPAGDRETWPGPDEERPVTEQGRRKMRKASKGLRDVIGRPDLILSSPYARTQQTAEIVAKALRHTGEVELADPLVHGGDPRTLAKLLEARPGARSVVLVGHSPDLERWISYVTTGREEPTFLELKKGGVCRVDVEALEPEPRGVVRWVLTPAVLRDLA